VTALLKVWPVVILLIICLYSYAKAEDFNTKALQGWCNSAPNTPEDVACSNYMAGFIAGAAYARQPELARIFCPPKNLTGVDGRNAFVWMTRINRDLLNKPPGAALWGALAMTFPCGASN
jgi:hypothetical protein